MKEGYVVGVTLSGQICTQLNKQGSIFFGTRPISLLKYDHYYSLNYWYPGWHTSTGKISFLKKRVLQRLIGYASRKPVNDMRRALNIVSTKQHRMHQ
jgi:hypothetical protein